MQTTGIRKCRIVVRKAGFTLIELIVLKFSETGGFKGL
ncbi:prepilin-type N-terminal cleavage/methylation domain-containing protein [Paenibacillus campinasensis]|uniref:Prepilin-type N-terminal cleavage/methylation domain-containing protein n=1 Tax=Paenibacillus campinasensis TaxID=66347 RepID=A0ABW9SYQ3_9BACL|nr:prepilin-type N-terminal cleavage/methylation domain-containing protein [Paenibacillus campinasensis]